MQALQCYVPAADPADPSAAGCGAGVMHRFEQVRGGCFWFTSGRICRAVFTGSSSAELGDDVSHEMRLSSSPCDSCSDIPDLTRSVQVKMCRCTRHVVYLCQRDMDLSSSLVLFTCHLLNI